MESVSKMKSAKCPACGATMREISRPLACIITADYLVADRWRCAFPTFLPKNVPLAGNDTFLRRRLRRWTKPSTKDTVFDDAGEPLDL